MFPRSIGLLACGLLVGISTQSALAGILIGGCCFRGGSCEVLDSDSCAAAGGAYEGDGTDCAPNPCPPPPPNDECPNATNINCGSSRTFNNSNATENPADPDFSCRRDGPDQGVGTMWYKFRPTDTSASISSCNSAAADTLLAVYTLAPQAHLLLSEVTLAPTSGEFIEIFNPTASDVDLTNYYLSDDDDYAKLPAAPTIDATTDFIARFPAGATAPAGRAVVVALSGNGFATSYGVNADFEIIGNNPATPDMTRLFGGDTVGLTNAGEGVVLFTWNGATDLVTDVDMVNAGIPSAANRIANKTSLAVDGPDADATPSTYLDDAYTMPAQATAPGTGASAKRLAVEGADEMATGGNGITGNDETTENILATWTSAVGSPNPGVCELVCSDRVEIACNDDACGERAEICVQGLVPGLLYFVQVASYDEAALGEITLDLTCPCGTEATGACCFSGTGDCFIQTESACGGSMGNYQGDGSACDPSPCPQPGGACCFPDTGDCFFAVSETACAGSMGNYQGDGTVCDPNPCPQPGGACCFPDTGDCFFAASETACAGSMGDYQGDGTDCDPNPCPQPSGACCFADTGDCTIQTEAACTGSMGNYQGDGTDCDPNPCPEPSGACCFTDGTCQELLLSACVAQSGTFRGIGTFCDPNPCPQPTGACCLVGGVCSVRTTAQCDSLSGDYQGNATTCSPNPCPQPPVNDDCASAESIECGAAATVDNSLATTSPIDPAFSCRGGDGPAQGVGTMWFKFVAADTSARISTCESAAGDTLLGVYSVGELGDHLLLCEATLTPTPDEFIEIFNPTDATIDLSTYYLSDDDDYAKLAGQGGGGPAPVIGTPDFLVKFPVGATIAPGAEIVVAVNGAGFAANFGFTADFEILSTDAATTDMTPIIVGSGAGLTNDGEQATLFAWDGASDLVLDVDMANLGTPTAANAIADKTSLSVDGPDGDALASTYLADAHTMPQQLSDAGPGVSTKRIRPEGADETASGGNGITGHDETTENIQLTWDAVYSRPNPGLCGVACGALTEIACSDDACGLRSELCVEGLTPGETYYVQVASFSDSSRGPITLSVDCPCPSTPTGACCHEDGSCTIETRDDCLAAFGAYRGDDSLCEPNPCPQPGEGDACETPTRVNTNAQITVEDHGGWFAFRATGDATSIETCGADFDTILQVLAEDCATVLAQNDDCDLSGSFGAGSDPNASCFLAQTFGEADSCLCLATTPGTEYRIRVGQFAGSGDPPDDPPAINTIVLTLTDKTECRSCNTCEGDVNGDGTRDGADIADMAACLIAANAGEPTPGCGCADMPTRDNFVDQDDLPPFINAMLSGAGDCP